MRGARVGIISNNRSVVRAVTRALVSAGARTRGVPLEAPATEEVLATEPQLVLLDTDGEPEKLQPVIDMLVAKRESRETPVLMLSRDLSPNVARTILESDVNHLVAKHGVVSVSRDLVDETELIVTCRKLITGELFGLEQYLALPGLDIHQYELKSSAERSSALDSLEAFLRELDLQQAMNTVILTVADELMMNAVYSAPRDDLGRPKYEHLDRRSQFDLTDKERVLLRYGCDGRNVVLSVNDNFGALAREMIFKYIGSGLFKEKGVIEQKDGGAGLGLHLVFNSISQLVFNVDRGRRTEVIAGFYVRSGFRGLRASGQSLNLFLKG
jgi:hypothetical protein